MAPQQSSGNMEKCVFKSAFSYLLCNLEATLTSLHLASFSCKVRVNDGEASF